MPTASAPERQRLDDVGAAADAGVEQHRQAVGGLDDPGQTVDGGNAAVGLAAAVVGAVDAVDAAVLGAPRVVGMADALDDQRQRRSTTQPGQVVPRQRIAEDRSSAAPPPAGSPRGFVAGSRGTPGRWCSWPGSGRAGAGSSTCVRSRGRQPGIQVSSVTTMPLNPAASARCTKLAARSRSVGV